MRRWTVWHSAEGFGIKLTEQPTWAVALEHGWDRLCGATGGRLGGHGLGEWAWRLPLGRPVWDRTDPDEPWLTNSLAASLNNVEQWVCRVAYEQERVVYEAPVDEQTGKRLFGEDSSWLWQDEGEAAT